MNNILITGAKGQLGSEIKELSLEYPAYNLFFTDVEELDICDKKAVAAYVVLNNINAIVNCAAYTAVDKAESEPVMAEKINHLAVKYLAEIAKEQKLRLVHISTDYVFDGKGFQPYPTQHTSEPVNMYGKTKLKGENAMRAINPANSMIIRTSWVYSFYGNNFLKTMLRLGREKEELKVINDQVGVPTYARDLAKFILDHSLKVTNELVAVYHYTNEGVCSWYDFAKEIMELGGRKSKVIPIPTTAYPTPAKRPFYSLMDKTSLKDDFKVAIPYWKDSLKDCVEKLKSATNN